MTRGCTQRTSRKSRCLLPQEPAWQAGAAGRTVGAGGKGRPAHALSLEERPSPATGSAAHRSLQCPFSIHTRWKKQSEGTDWNHEGSALFLSSGRFDVYFSTFHLKLWTNHENDIPIHHTLIFYYFPLPLPHIYFDHLKQWQTQ